MDKIDDTTDQVVDSLNQIQNLYSDGQTVVENASSLGFQIIICTLFPLFQIMFRKPRRHSTPYYPSYCISNLIRF